MQNIRSIILLIIIITNSSCNFSQSVNTDLTTGAYARGDGIKVNDIIIEINGEAVNRNEFVFGEKVDFIFKNVSGLTNSGGKTFPKLSMHIVKNEKDTVFASHGLLKGLDNGTDLSPLQLRANFIAALPNQNNEKYRVFIEIKDVKGDGKFHYELPFTIKENNLLDIKTNGIDYSNIYLWDETLKKPVLDNNVSSEHRYILILNGIEGLSLTDEKVFPIFSLDLVDKNGNKIISKPNLLSAYKDKGANPKDLKSQVTAKITFTKGTINNPCVLTATLKDKNSSKEINISTKLIIE